MKSKDVLCLSKDDLMDRRLSFAVCFQVTAIGIKNALVQAIPLLYRYNGILNYMFFAVILGVYLHAVSKATGRLSCIHWTTLLFPAVVLVSFMISPLHSTNNIPVMLELLPGFVMFSILTFMLLSSIRSMRWIEYYMTRFCYWILLSAVISALFIYRNGHTAVSDHETYSMPLSYSTLVSVMWLLYKRFKYGKTRDLIFAFVGIAVIIAYGSRNPLLAIGAYFVLHLIRSLRSRKCSSWKKLLYMFLILFIIIFMLRMDLIIRLLISVLGVFNISSRTLNLLAEASDFSTGRDAIHMSILAELNRHPLTGLGVGGDVGIVGDLSHGLFISLFATYGYFLGSFVIAGILLFVWWGYRRSSGLCRDIVLMYICMVLPRSLTGMDIWSYDVVWWMLGTSAIAISSRNAGWRVSGLLGLEQ